MLAVEADGRFRGSEFIIGFSDDVIIICTFFGYETWDLLLEDDTEFLSIYLEWILEWIRRLF
jgi:hypothetical protein